MSDKALNDSDIIHYLNQNKDFFVKHPEQLELLKVNTNSGKVTSLVNHQVNVLKERNTQLKLKFSQLIHYAEENEKLMNQVFELTLHLCQISHIANVTKHFTRFVKQSFDSDLFKIILPSYENLDKSASVICVGQEDKEFEKAFKSFLKQGKPVCGRIKKDKLNYIFSNQANSVGSCVLLPIGDHAKKGILVFASFDENRFQTDMSTDLLSRLADILDKKFKNVFPSFEH